MTYTCEIGQNDHHGRSSADYVMIITWRLFYKVLCRTLSEIMIVIDNLSVTVFCFIFQIVKLYRFVAVDFKTSH